MQRTIRFELIKGTKRRFWQATLDGEALSQRYGRIDSEGSSVSKKYASAEAAAADLDKKVRKKLKEGYLEAYHADMPREDKLALLNVSRPLLRNRSLEQIEADWTAPEAPLDDGCKLWLCGKPKYYELADLKASIRELGHQVVTKPVQATHMVVMTLPKDKLQKGLDASLPVVLERHLKEHIEAGVSALVPDNGPAADNLSSLLRSQEASQLEQALALLKAGTIPQGVLPSLVALWMLGDKSERAKARSVLLSKAPPELAKHVNESRRAYHRAVEHKPFSEGIEAMAALGVDAAALASDMVLRVSRRGDVRATGSAIAAALPHGNNDPEAFEVLRGTKTAHFTGLNGPWPKGFACLEDSVELRLEASSMGGNESVWSSLSNLVAFEAQKTTLANLDFLPLVPGLERLALHNVTVPDLEALAGHPGLKRLDFQPGDTGLLGTGLDHSRVTPARALAPLANLPALEEVHFENTAIRNFAAMASAPSLRRLTITRHPPIELDSLRRMEGLTHFTYRPWTTSDAGPVDLAPLSRLTALESLALGHFPCRSFEPLASVTALRSLEIQCGPSHHGVEALAELPNLKLLTMYGASKEAVEHLRTRRPGLELRLY
ncbi:MAG: WGR domain-containing protein [Myxococcota bacterium]